MTSLLNTRVDAAAYINNLEVQSVCQGLGAAVVSREFPIEEPFVELLKVTDY